MQDSFGLEAKRAWEYLRLSEAPQHADIIYAVGSPSLKVVDKAFELYAAGFAKKIAFISGTGTFSNPAWHEHEYKIYHEAFVKKGVPEHDLIYGIGTGNTLEEAKAAIPFLREHGIDPKKIILVSIPVHQRRAHATFIRQHPDVTYINCPADVAFEENEEFYERVALEVERVQMYGTKGDMVKLVIPTEVASIVQHLRIAASVTVLTKNSASTLERALSSVRYFDEIVICDGGSTDDTLAIARSFGAHVIHQDPVFLENGKIFDYSGVRNQTLAAAKHNWIFWLDSDEYCGDGIVRAMRDIVRTRGENGRGAFWVNRKYVIDGTVIDCAATYPNRQMRFFSKNATDGMVKKIHERIKVRPDVTPEILDGVMCIPFEADKTALRRKWDYQIAVAAQQVAPMPPGMFIEAVFHSAKVSALWFFRLARNALFCSGTKMPLAFEMERHYFHWRLLRALWRVVKL